MNNKRIIKFLSIAIISLVVVSCRDNPFIITQINCPAVAIVSNTGNLFSFKGEGRDNTDIAYSATISGVNTDCLQGEGVYETFSFNITVRRGPQMEGREIVLPYFVVLMRDNNLITAKQVYEAKIRFEANQEIATVRETIVQAFEDVEVARRYDYELLIGFQLTPDELAFNVFH